MANKVNYTADVVIVGAGMAGSSLAAMLGPSRSVIILEAEEFAGYHATGRSAAFWQESYGGEGVQPLTTASEEFLAHPAAAFSERPFLSERRAYVIGRAGETHHVDRFTEIYRARGVGVERWASGELVRAVDGILPDWTECAVERSCQDIDVSALHQAYLRSAKKSGVDIVTKTALRSARRVNGSWLIETDEATVQAGIIVNAAGAWADQIAASCGVAPLGIQPFRRTMLQLRLDVATPATLPLIEHVSGEFYFKGEGEGRIWLSPHDETPSLACDAAAEEIDVAVAIERFHAVVNWPIAAVERKWAGLRSFAPDRLPVFGEDPNMSGFYWCAGQGGFGIQTAPAISTLLAAQLGGDAPRGKMAEIDVRLYSPARFL